MPVLLEASGSDWHARFIADRRIVPLLPIVAKRPGTLKSLRVANIGSVEALLRREKLDRGAAQRGRERDADSGD